MTTTDINRLINIGLKMYDNVTKQTLYVYIWDPLRLVKVGYDYMLYYFMKFIGLCKICFSYSYTLILGNVYTRG